jgi:hypothetical protein
VEEEAGAENSADNGETKKEVSSSRPHDPYLLWRILLTSLKRKMAVNFGSSAWSADYRGSVIDSDGKA